MEKLQNSIWSYILLSDNSDQEHYIEQWMDHSERLKDWQKQQRLNFILMRKIVFPTNITGMIDYHT